MIKDETIYPIRVRLKEFLKQINISEGAFEGKCGLSTGYVSGIKTGIGSTTMAKIRKAYSNLNTDWLISGDGKMFNKQQKEQNKDPISDTYIEDSIPIYDIEINAGVITRLIDDNNDIPLAGWLYLKDNPNTTGLIGVRAKGDSMSTFIDGGDIMLIRKLQNFDFIPPGHAYVVISEELSIVKYVRNGKDDNHWTLRSHNANYEDFSVKRSAVKHLFIVVKVLKELSY